MTGPVRWLVCIVFPPLQAYLGHLPAWQATWLRSAGRTGGGLYLRVLPELRLPADGY